MTKTAPHNGTLGPKQTALLAALVRGETIESAALASGISKRTAYRWQRELPFQDALDLAESKAFEKTLRRLMTGTGQALDVLAKAMNDEKCPYSTRVHAAEVWCTNAFTVHKIRNLEAKMKELAGLLEKAYP